MRETHPVPRKRASLKRLGDSATSCLSRCMRHVSFELAVPPSWSRPTRIPFRLGVRPKRACRLPDTFGNGEAVLTASLDELVEVSGIGLRTVEGIRHVVGEPRGRYAV